MFSLFPFHQEPWTQNPPKVILDLHKNKKSEVDSHIFKTEFLEIKSAYKHYISIYTDGSKQDGKVACAVITGWERTVHMSRCQALYSGRIFVSLCRELIIFVF